MNFHEHLSVYNALRKSKQCHANEMKAVDWYDRWIAGAARAPISRDPIVKMAFVERINLERTWCVDKRPYYNVWPAAVHALTRLPLGSVDCGLIHLPLPALLLRFAVDHEVPLYDGRKMLSVLAGRIQLPGDIEGLLLFVDVGVRDKLHGSEVSELCIRSFPLEPGKSLEDALHVPVDVLQIRSEQEQEEQMFLPAIRLICTLCLMDRDPDLFEPDVLTEDKPKFEETRDPKFVEKAIHRNKYGWNIGAHLDISPHWRKPHFALRWTGPGHAMPRIVPVRGAIVRLHSLKDIPTGRLDDECHDPENDPDQPTV